MSICFQTLLKEEGAVWEEWTEEQVRKEAALTYSDVDYFMHGVMDPEYVGTIHRLNPWRWVRYDSRKKLGGVL